MPTIKFKINNITCPACITLSTSALSEISGVTAASVDLTSGDAIVESTKEISPNEIRKALAKIGKEPMLP